MGGIPKRRTRPPCSRLPCTWQEVVTCALINTVIGPITKLDLTVATLQKGGSVEPRTGAATAATKVSLRPLDLEENNRYFLSNGVLADETSPGGTGQARSVWLGSAELAASGGSVVQYNLIQTPPPKFSIRV